MNTQSAKRRPEARPSEILTAALDLFAERGFAATRLDDVAARAGLSKAAIYLYFDDKMALLRAIFQELAQANVGNLERAMAEISGPVAPLLRQFLETVAERIQQSHLPALMKLVISESRAQPEIGRQYLDNVIGVAFPLLQSLIARGIASGEFREIDPAMAVRSLVAPMLLAGLWRSVFEPIGAEPIDAVALARVHADIMLRGLAGGERSTEASP